MWPTGVRVAAFVVLNHKIFLRFFFLTVNNERFSPGRTTAASTRGYLIPTFLSENVKDLILEYCENDSDERLLLF